MPTNVQEEFLAHLRLIDAQAERLARTVEARPALRKDYAERAGALEVRLSVVERALAVVAPKALAALRPALSETKLDLRFVQKEGEFISCRLARFLRSPRVEEPELLRRLDDVEARVASAGEASADLTRPEAVELAQQLDEIELNLQALWPGALEARGVQLERARQRLLEIVRDPADGLRDRALLAG